MTSGAITARFLRTGMTVQVDWEEGHITRVGPAEESAAASQLEGRYAMSWAQNIWADMLA